MNLKRIFPRSLYKRFILIIALPIIIIQLVSVYVFYDTHLYIISKHMARSNIEQINFIIKKYDDLNLQQFVKKINNFSSINFSEINEDIKLNTKDQEGYFFDEFFEFKNELKLEKIEFYNFNVNKQLKQISFVIKTDNHLLRFQVPIKRIAPARADIFIFWLIFTSLLALFISITFLKNQIRSINNLKEVAEKFGRGQDVPNIKPSGSEEIRSLAISFIRMRDRVLRQVAQRTDMLSAVSHDLRTPLTRMKLQLAMMKNSQEIEELKTDINDMENIVDEYLEFTKSDEKERPKKINIRHFLENDIVAYYNKTGNIIKDSIKLDETLKISIRKTAIKRSLINLLDNAFRYGDIVELNSVTSSGNLIINIDDNGPGIPAKERQNVLKPFYRSDDARNLDKNISNNYKNKGSGLGLAIVNDTISAHGGRIKLAKSHLGGLKVTLYIPL